MIEFILFVLTVLAIVTASAAFAIIKHLANRRKINRPSEILAAPEVRIIGFRRCGWETKTHECASLSLVNCISNYCHQHCPKQCECGAGVEAKALIEKYGSLRRAEKELPFELIGAEVNRIEFLPNEKTNH